MACAKRLRRVFDHDEPTRLGDLHDATHLGADTAVMHRHDGARAFVDGVFDRSLIDAQRVFANIDENGSGAAQHEGIGSARKGKARHNDFVARPDPRQHRGHLQGCGAGGGQQYPRRADRGLEPRLAPARECAAAPEAPGPQDFDEIFKLAARFRRAVERDLCHRTPLPAVLADAASRRRLSA